VEIFSVRKEYLDFVGKSVDASVAKARKVVIELNASEPLGTLNSIVKEASRLLRNEFFLWKVMEEGLEYGDSHLALILSGCGSETYYSWKRPVAKTVSTEPKGGSV